MKKSMLLSALIVAAGIIGGVWLNNYLSPHQSCVRAALAIPSEGKGIETPAERELRAHQWCWKQNDPH